MEIRTRALSWPCKPLVIGVLASAALTAHAVQPTVTLPQSIDLGNTSFMDGFGGQPGQLAIQSYLSFAHADAYKTNNGSNSPAFNDPRVNATTYLEQLLYQLPTNTTILGGHPGFDAILPLVSLNTSFSPPPPLPGAMPTSGHTGLGDISVGALLQWDPLLVNGHPLFASRAEIYAIAPTGKYDSTTDMNPGSHQWAVGVMASMTLMLGPDWEISLRPHYLYSFKNGSPASSAPLDPGIENTQAGQAAYLNFATSWRATEKLRIGVSGYYLRQLTDDRINGATTPDSREQVLGIGPGLYYDMRKSDKFWLNTYTEAFVRNRFRNRAVVNLRWIHVF